MLLGLYNAELRKMCLVFMSKEIQHKREFKVVLDHQLVNLKTYNQDPRAPSHDMAGLRSTYSFEKSVDARSEEMLKTGQVPMDVNAMPELATDKSEYEDKEDKGIEGGINAMQEGKACFFSARKSAGNMKNGRKRMQTGHQETVTGNPFPVITVGKTGIF